MSRTSAPRHRRETVRAQMAERGDGQDPGADDLRDRAAQLDGPGDVGGRRIGAVTEAATILDPVAVAVGAASLGVDPHRP